jgi:two-component system CheB/CheR fusion protein
MVVFASQNVIKDPPFTKLEILSCRNLFIYLDSKLQDNLLSMFHYSLNSDGILLLGSAETNGDQSNLFSVIDSKLRIYQRSSSSVEKDLLDFPVQFAEIRPALIENQKLIPVKAEDNLQSLVGQLLLQQFLPSSALVNSQGDMLYLIGNTGKYLAPAAGKANMNIFAMARDGIREELPGAFRKAIQNHEKVVLRSVKVGTNGGTLLVNLTVQQIESPLSLKGNIMVIFADALVEQKSSKFKKGKTCDIVAQKELELELQRVKEDLQTTLEEMQTSQEELKSANEELQSANEELTTSKEEMQSLNDELHTVNAELQAKVNFYALTSVALIQFKLCLSCVFFLLHFNIFPYNTFVYSNS